MLKKFFVSMLGTIAGIWVSAVLIIAVLVVFAIGAVSSLSLADKSAKVDDRSVLHIRLEGNFEEIVKPASIRQLIIDREEKARSARDIIRAVTLATDDKRIEGIWLECLGSSMDIACREELEHALRAFRDSGKWIHAYADSYTQGDYLLATTANEIVLNPVGEVNVRGFAGMTPFFKNLLDKLGIRMQVVKVGTYKSAVEPFILTEMSQPARRQQQTYIDSMWAYAGGTMARNLSLPVADINSWATDMIGTWSAERALEAGAVTRLAYAREIREGLAELTGFDKADDLRLVTPEDYLKDKGSKDWSGKRHIAVLYALGDIDASGDGIASDDFVPDIIDLADDDDVAALVMRVNSGGGSAFASEQIWEALEYFKEKGKPFVVSMGDMAASGAYYISSGADYIWADTTTLTGSIGVFGLIPDFSGLINDKIGINYSIVASNPNAIFPSPLEALTPEQTEALQHSVERTYDLFTSRVAQGRHIPQDSVKAIGEGRVWIASDALRIGLVDQLGSLDDAIEYAADLANIDPDRIVTYPDLADKKWQKLLDEIMETHAGIDLPTAGQLMLIDALRRADPVQARMEPIRIIEK